ncbi:alpha/beta fold hydrolase [Bradyrhizobium cenepequi]|uniref:alpha/beta fold hydrolase n=1 Tax=Bradyrhizobium cenepequi TaxID=2821403 RepID=UPI001CE28D1D|nr:alpha/beta hydrolase [Bradyrhizobium cenepequi]MCA6111185.1 alpha/beta hydrolase [Bradyrhizobium cenepequi]
MLFVHGWCYDHASFAFQQAYVSRIRRTISGGLAVATRRLKNYDIEEFVDDLIHLCRELAPTKHHSVGATIALEFAARCPEYVAAAVLIDSVVFPTVNDADFSDFGRQSQQEVIGVHGRARRL